MTQQKLNEQKIRLTFKRKRKKRKVSSLRVKNIKCNYLNRNKYLKKKKLSKVKKDTKNNMLGYPDTSKLGYGTKVFILTQLKLIETWLVYPFPPMIRWHTGILLAFTHTSPRPTRIRPSVVTCSLQPSLASASPGTQPPPARNWKWKWWTGWHRCSHCPSTSPLLAEREVALFKAQPVSRRSLHFSVLEFNCLRNEDCSTR